MDDVIDDWLKEILPSEYFYPSIIELRWYFLNSLGNTTRIDYGTGHETCFVAFLYCLKRLGLFSELDFTAVVLKVVSLGLETDKQIFVAYIQLARKLQTVYGMEPAGSHGVWSLDDYHFLIFYFGSSQLRGMGALFSNKLDQDMPTSSQNPSDKQIYTIILATNISI